MKTFFACGIAITSTAFLSVPAISQDGCSEILSGIYDYRTTISDDQRYESFRNWVCDNQNASSSGSASFLIDGLPVGAEGDANWARSKCGETNTTSATRQRMMEIMQTVNSHVVGAWQSCMDRRGLKAGIRASSDPRTFSVVLSYVPVATAAPRATLYEGDTGFNISGGASCTSSWLNQEPRTISDTITIPCTRPDAKVPVTVTVNAEPSPITGQIELPKHRTCEQSVRTYSKTEMAMGAGQALSVQCGAGSTFTCRAQNDTTSIIDWETEGITQADRVNFTYKTFVTPDNYLAMSVNGAPVERNGSPIGCKYNSLALTCMNTICD